MQQRCARYPPILFNMVAIYVDGSYTSHGSHPASAGIGIYIEDKHPANIAATIIADDITNGTVELIAIYIALIMTQNIHSTKIYSDSQHAVDPLSSRHGEYIAAGWKTKKNKYISDHELFIACSNILYHRRKNNRKIKIKKIEAHSGNVGNNAADRLAYAAMNGDTSSIDGMHVVITVDNNICASVWKCNQIQEISKILSDSNGMTSETEDSEVVYMPPLPKINEPSIPGPSKELWTAPLIIPEDKGYKLLEWPNSDSESIKDHPIQCHLFVLCMSHAGMIWIKYPSGDPIASNKGLGKLSDCSIVSTVCRSCMTSSLTPKESIDPVTKSSELHKSMNMLSISPYIIEGSKAWECACNLSRLSPIVAISNNHTKYISIMDISSKCSPLCTAVSVNIDEKYAYDSLKMGFL